MPIKKKTTAAKKPAVLGPKAKLMKLAVTTLRNKAKKLGVSDVSKRTKENLVQSIILGEARKKRGTAAGKKATAKRTTSAGVRQSTRQTGTSKLKRDLNKPALAPGRRISKAGNVYYERRKNRSDKPGQLAGEKYNGWTNYWTWRLNLELLDPDFWIERIEEGNYNSVYELAEAIQSFYDELAGDVEPDWAQSFVDAAFSEVNWREIAMNVAEGTDLESIYIKV
jgi:hypothetical protein